MNIEKEIDHTVRNPTRDSVYSLLFNSGSDLIWSTVSNLVCDPVRIAVRNNLDSEMEEYEYTKENL